MSLPITRRAWLQLLAAAPALGQNVFDWRPDLNPRLDALWNRALGLPETATIVSSVVHSSLPPIRGWRDERFLNAYINWSTRPESARFDGDTLTADLGPYDWILFRRYWFHTWAKPIRDADPLGYALFKPGPGLHRIRIDWPPIMHEQPLLPIYGLSTQPLPTIEAVVAASGDVVTLYGSGFEGNKFEIASETGPGTILFATHNQVNARVPSLDRVRLIIDGSSSLWVPVAKR